MTHDTARVQPLRLERADTNGERADRQAQGRWDGGLLRRGPGVELLACVGRKGWNLRACAKLDFQKMSAHCEPDMSSRPPTRDGRVARQSAGEAGAKDIGVEEGRAEPFDVLPNRSCDSAAQTRAFCHAQ